MLHCSICSDGNESHRLRDLPSIHIVPLLLLVDKLLCVLLTTGSAVRMLVRLIFGGGRTSSASSGSVAIHT